MQFLKIATQMFPAERIENINTNAIINGNPGVEVKLHGVTDTFQYTGQYASLAYDVLENIQPVPSVPSTDKILVTINGQPVDVSEIRTIDGELIPVAVELDGKTVLLSELEWVDFAAQIGSQTGVEIRVSSDPVGVTRQYTGDTASTVYDILAELESHESQMKANAN